MIKGKRKIVRAATSGKVPGARKPRVKPPPWATKHDYCPFPPMDERQDEEDCLTYKQEKFVQFYIDCNGNATEAYVRAFNKRREVAKVLAHRMMKLDIVLEAIETRRADMAEALGITRERLLQVQVGIVMATLVDFSEVGRRPWSKESYRGLGDKVHGLKSVSVGEHGNTITMMDKQAALNELWKKLGFKEGTDSQDGATDNGRVLADVISILEKRSGK